MYIIVIGCMLLSNQGQVASISPQMSLAYTRLPCEMRLYSSQRLTDLHGAAPPPRDVLFLPASAWACRGPSGFGPVVPSSPGQVLTCRVS